VYSTNTEFAKGIVLGYLAGDGSKKVATHSGYDCPTVYVTSVRPRLLYQIRHLLASVGWGWGGTSFKKGFTDYRGWKNRDAYTLSINGVAGMRVRSELGLSNTEYKKQRDIATKYRIDGGYVWTRVRSVTPSEADYVYDIEVSHTDHSFETVIGAVANSEVAYYPNPVETIESSLIRAMHENPRTFLALESTAKRKDDWFHKTWKSNREGEKTGYNRFTCIFLPWYVGTDLYPTKDFLRNHPIPDNWEPMDLTRKQAIDARLYVKVTPLLQKYLGDNWEMPREQMWFYEFEYMQAKDDKEKYKAFLSELAADERTCFTSKRSEVFEHRVLDEIEKSVSEATYTDYAIVGDGIDKRLALREYQSPTARRIDVQYQSIDGKWFNWKLIPLRDTPADPKQQLYLS